MGVDGWYPSLSADGDGGHDGFGATEEFLYCQDLMGSGVGVLTTLRTKEFGLVDDGGGQGVGRTTGDSLMILLGTRGRNGQLEVMAASFALILRGRGCM